MGRTAEGGGAPLCASSLKRRRRVPTVRPRLGRWGREGGRTRRSKLTWPGSCTPRPGSRRSCRSEVGGGASRVGSECQYCNAVIFIWERPHLAVDVRLDLALTAVERRAKALDLLRAGRAGDLRLELRAERGLGLGCETARSASDVSKRTGGISESGEVLMRVYR